MLWMLIQDDANLNAVDTPAINIEYFCILLHDSQKNQNMLHDTSREFCKACTQVPRRYPASHIASV